MLTLPLSFLQRPAAATTPRPWLLVLMHGVGSNEQDLFSLAPQIPDRFHVLSLRAPFRMGPGSHAWFDFSIEPNGERTINEEQEAQSRALVAQAVESAAEQLGIPPERVVVGSGSMTHNLAEFFGGEREPAPYVLEFSRWIENALARGDMTALLNYRSQAPHAHRAHPTEDHFLPIFFALGAAGDDLHANYLSREVMYSMLSMDAFALEPVH